MHTSMILLALPEDNQIESDPKHDIANVGEDMVEVGECSNGVGTQEVVVAKIFVACRSRVTFYTNDTQEQFHLFDSRLSDR